MTDSFQAHFSERVINKAPDPRNVPTVPPFSEPAHFHLEERGKQHKARCPALSHSPLETSKSVPMALLWVACYFSCSTSPAAITPSNLIPPRFSPCHVLSRVLLYYCSRESNIFLVAACLNVRALLVGRRGKSGRKS